MTERRPRVLLTGFEPFDGQKVNASWLAVEQVVRTWDGPAELVSALLPVSFRRARQVLRTVVAATEPDVVVLVGEAGGRAAVGLERVALNVIDARIADADGSRPVDVPVVAGAPAAFFSRLPIKAMLAAARATGVPVEVSNTAGTYVCNATAYALGHLLERGPAERRGGLVHVPRTPEQVGDGGPSLATDDVARALTAAVTAALASGHGTLAPAESAGTEA